MQIARSKTNAVVGLMVVAVLAVLAATANSAHDKYSLTSRGIFPDFQLPDHTNTARKPSELQGDDPLILMLARVTTEPKNNSNIWNSPLFW